MSERRCCECDGPSRDGFDVCDGCNHALMTGWPVLLGAAIKIFARRAEVERAHRQLYVVIHAFSPTFDEYMDAMGALERMKAWALEGI